MEFFIIENGQQAGPFSLNQLVEKKISAETLVWAQGMADWTPAWKVDDLKLVLEEIERQKVQASANATQTQVPPTPEGNQTQTSSCQQTATSQYGQQTTANKEASFTRQEPLHEEPKKKKWFKYIWKLVALLLVVLFLSMAFTNPNEEAHKKAIKLEIGTAIDSLTSSTGNNFFTQGFRVVAKMMADNLMGNALNNLFEYHNYIIFSKGTVNFNGKDHTISYGVFGKVITMNADDMINALEKNGNVQIEESSSDANVPQAESQDDEDNVEDKAAPSNSDDFTEVDDNDTHDKSEDTKLEEKANKALDKISKKVGKKVEEKINKKLDEVAQDSSAIEKIIDAVLNFF